MSISSKKTVIVGGIIVALAGTGYFIYCTFNEKSKEVTAKIETLGKSLPPQFKLKAVKNEFGLFNSTGSYSLSYSNPINKSYNGELVINYKSSHGIMTLFGEDIKFTATSHLKGNIVKTLQIKTKNNKFSRIEGLLKDGNLTVKNLINNINFVISQNDNIKEELKVDIKSITDEISVISDSGNIFKKITIPEIQVSSTNVSPKILFKNTSLDYDTNIKNIKFTKFRLKSESIELLDAEKKLANLDFSVITENKNKQNQIKFNLNIPKTNYLGYTDASVALEVSLENIDNNLYSVYQNILPIYLSGSKVYDQKAFIDGINSGFIFNVKNLSVIHDKSKFDINGNYEIEATEEEKDFSLEFQSKFELNVNGDSNLFQKSLLSKIVAKSEKKDLSLLVKYDNGSLKVNEKYADQKLTNSVKKLLKEISFNNSLETSEKQ